MYNEKRSELEEQQLHLNVGLSKIRDTFSQVEELQKSLGAKRAQLREKDELGMFVLQLNVIYVSCHLLFHYAMTWFMCFLIVGLSETLMFCGYIAYCLVEHSG